MYKITFHPNWDQYFLKLDNSIQIKILKKIEKLQYLPPGRHLKQGIDYFVEEIGQYRVAYNLKSKNHKKIYFVGTHKDYEKWLGLRKL